MHYRNAIAARILIPFYLAAFLAGCAGQSARTVALTTLQSAAQYEKELDKKIAAETRFYKQQSENLHTKLSGFPPLTPCHTGTNGATLEASRGGTDAGHVLRLCKIDKGGVLKEVGDDDIRNGWLYGRIYSTTLLDGRKTAAELLARGSDAETVVLIMDFVGRGILESHAAITEVRAEQAMLIESIAKNIAPVAKQKKRLASLRKGLTALATDSDDISQLKQLGTIISATAKEINKVEAPNPAPANQ